MNGRRKGLAHLWAILCSLVAIPCLSGEEAVILPLTLNAVASGEAFVLIADDGDVWIDVDALTRSSVGLGERGSRRKHENRELVSLRSLAPEVAFELDEGAWELRVTVAPALLGLLRFTRGTARPENLEILRGDGGFLNYRATVSSFDDLTGIVDAGWSVRNTLVYSSGFVDAEGRFRRGTTHLTIDDPSKMRRIAVGDSFARTDQLGGALSLGGVSISREFLLDPYFVRLPSLDLTGAVMTPSTVEVYVNGALVDRRQVPPGRFAIDQLSLPTGRGSATVLIRDAFGGERMLVEPFYASTFALETGLSEYNYAVGFRRENESSESFDYGDAAFLATHRWGLSKRFTAGYRAEIAENLWSGGGTLVMRSLGGELSLQAAASNDHGDGGAALSARYAYLTRSYGASVGWTEVGDHYANTSVSAAFDRVTRRIDLLGTLRLGRIDLGLNAAFEERRDRGSANRAAVTATYPIRQRATLFVSAGAAETEGETSPELGFGVAWNLGFLRSANLRVDRRNEETAGSVSFQQNLGREPGWGYRLEGGMTGEDDTSTLRVQRQTRNFLFEVDANPSIASDAVNVSAAGGVAWGRGRAHLMRPAQQSYAIVRVPGVEGVRVYVSNLEAGRTDARGELIVTDLIPYYGNRIRIEDSDVPVAYRIDQVERVVAPPLRGGVVVEFPVTPAASVAGVAAIVLEDGATRIPATGEMRLARADGSVAISPIGRGGEFYFEGVAPGQYEVEMIDDRGATCRTRLEIAASEKPVRDLGTVTCREDRP